jgi:hypothetical protein
MVWNKVKPTVVDGAWYSASEEGWVPPSLHKEGKRKIAGHRCWGSLGVKRQVCGC